MRRLCTSARRASSFSKRRPDAVSSACFRHRLSIRLPIAKSANGREPWRQRALSTTSVLKNHPSHEIPHFHSESTIYALSTAPGRAAIAIIRISGPACVEVYQALCPGRRLPKPRHASIRTLYDPAQIPRKNPVLDSSALVLFFPGPQTVTGEDVLELHVHGGPAVVKAVLNAIPRCLKPVPGLRTASMIRYAEPGEFTRRAFLNDRLALTQVEALGDTLAADTEQQRLLAVRGASASLAKRYESWRQQLLYARGELEALIDFSEDQHFDESPHELISSITSQVQSLKRQMKVHIENASKGELLRNGITIALLGAPNAGKSSLLNRIVGREAAIVSTEQGTTRDVVDVGVDIGGWFCRLGDMAGLRTDSTIGTTESANHSSSVLGSVEKEGIRRAKARALESDVVIVVLSLEGGENRTTPHLNLEPEVLEAVKSCFELGKVVVTVINKTDLVGLSDSHIGELMSDVQAKFPALTRSQVFAISCKYAQDPLSNNPDPGNIQTFLKGLMQTFEDMASPKTTDVQGESRDASYWADSLGVTYRQSSNLQRCIQHLNDFLMQASLDPLSEYDDLDVDIVAAAEHLRFAADCLAKITGKGEAGDVEEVLGVVFEK